MWERSQYCDGPWQEVADFRVPITVIRRYNRTVKRGSWDLIVPAYRYYYRFRFCV